MGIGLQNGTHGLPGVGLWIYGLIALSIGFNRV